MPLYRVNVEFEVYVVAACEEQAEQIAEDNMHRFPGNDWAHISVSGPVRLVHQLPGGIAATYPYGGTGERTCADYLENKRGRDK